MREINPLSTNRAESYQAFINAPMPMVTLFKTLDVTKAVKLSKKGYKLNMLLCYCIGLAAQSIPEFKLLPMEQKMYAYDAIGVNVIVANDKGGINSCDLPFSADLDTFNKAYLELTDKVAKTCENYELSELMIIGTSCLSKYEVDGIVNMYSGIFNNPFLAWGKYEKRGFKAYLKVSFQFHHVQMDGEQACRFLDEVQNNIRLLKCKNL